jgi:hypothetical protein
VVKKKIRGKKGNERATSFSSDSEKEREREREREREKESAIFMIRNYTVGLQIKFFSASVAWKRTMAHRWRIAISIFAHEFAVVENKVVHPDYECRWIDIICARK